MKSWEFFSDPDNARRKSMSEIVSNKGEIKGCVGTVEVPSQVNPSSQLSR